MAGTKIRLTEQELTYLIKRIVTESMSHDEELDEGLFGPSEEELSSRRDELVNKIYELLDSEGVSEEDLVVSVNTVLRRAEEDNYDGEVRLTYGKRGRNEGRPILVFEKNPSWIEKTKFYKNVMKPMVGGMKGGHEFGSGQ
jgi:hypothetical protein